MEAFDRIWIDCLNGDKYKTGKLTPEGAPDPRVFSTEWNREGIQVGTAIALLVRRSAHIEAGAVRFRNLWGKNKRAELLADYDVYLNDLAYWRNVPETVWSYTIGGYQVMKKWLSYREQDLLGRSLSADEAREVTAMARRIAAIRLLEPALDANYARVAEAAVAPNAQ